MKTQNQRVVVTGVGIVSAIGTDKASFANGLFACKTGIGETERFDRYFEDCYAAEVVSDWQYEGLSTEEQEQYDKVALWAYKVAKEALVDAKLANEVDRSQIGMMLAISGAGTEPLMKLVTDGDIDANALKTSGDYNSAAQFITSKLALGGGYEIIATACTASTNAMGLAFDALRSGKAKHYLVLASEPLYLPTFAGFKVLDAMAPGACSPFSGEPGMSVGEGAGALILESYESAKARGAHIYGEILSYATSCDAYHETSPEPRGEGAAMVMRLALQQAQIEPADIDYLNAHGTGTRANDRAESSAINQIFAKSAEECPSVPVSSSKAYFGHNISAAGIMEFIACLLTLPERKIIPTLNYSGSRDYVNLNIVANQCADANVDVFMKNNYAFGGNNCSVITSMNPGKHLRPERRKNRVVISGVGCLNAIGLGYDAFCSGLATEKDYSSVREIDVLNTKKPNDFHWLANAPKMRAALEKLPLDTKGNLTLPYFMPPEFNSRKVLRSVDTRKLHKVTLYSMVALEQALANAGLKVSKAHREEFGLIMGLARGPQQAIDTFFGSIYPEPSNVRTSEFPKALYNSISSTCATIKGMRGYNSTLATGRGASLGALIQAYEVIREDRQRFMLAGGADEDALNFSLCMAAANQSSQMNLNQEASSFRPYDRQSQGYFLAEGAAMFVLESFECAQRREAAIEAEVIGWGRANSVDSSTEEKGAALARAITMALSEADISPEQVNLIVGSSFGELKADLAETLGLKSVFGEACKSIPYTTINARTGFAPASSALLNTAVAVNAINTGYIPEIAHSNEVIDQELDFVLGKARQQSVDYALVVSYNEFANYSVVVLGVPESLS